MFFFVFAGHASVIIKGQDGMKSMQLLKIEFEGYAHSPSCQEYGEKIDTTLLSVSLILYPGAG